MLAKRIIPCLDVTAGRVNQVLTFEGLERQVTDSAGPIPWPVASPSRRIAEPPVPHCTRSHLLVLVLQSYPSGQRFSTPHWAFTHTPWTQVNPALHSESGFSSTVPSQLLSLPSQISGEGRIIPLQSPTEPSGLQSRTPSLQTPSGTPLPSRAAPCTRQMRSSLVSGGQDDVWQAGSSLSETLLQSLSSSLAQSRAWGRTWPWQEDHAPLVEQVRVPWRQMPMSRVAEGPS